MKWLAYQHKESRPQLVAGGKGGISLIAESIAAEITKARNG